MVAQVAIFPSPYYLHLPRLDDDVVVDDDDGVDNGDDDDDVSSSLFSAVTLCSAKPFGRKTPWALEVVFEARC